MTTMTRRLLLVAALTAATVLGACGDTWRGVKKDTGENVSATGAAVERTGDAIRR
ncbi:MAG: hypothetical protein O3A88_02150 [Proteobacteria bacterium]|nr:hypothetical protein [Pseudomonadota bacterium]